MPPCLDCGEDEGGRYGVCTNCSDARVDRVRESIERGPRTHVSPDAPGASGASDTADVEDSSDTAGQSTLGEWG